MFVNQFCQQIDILIRPIVWLDHMNAPFVQLRNLFPVKVFHPVEVREVVSHLVIDLKKIIHQDGTDAAQIPDDRCILIRTKRLEELSVVVAVIFLQVFVVKSEHIGYDRRNFCPADSFNGFGFTCFAVLNIDMFIWKNQCFQVLEGVMLVRHVCSPPCILLSSL